MGVNLALDLRALDRINEGDKILSDTLTRLRARLGEQHPATLNALRSIWADCDVDPVPHLRTIACERPDRVGRRPAMVSARPPAGRRRLVRPWAVDLLEQGLHRICQRGMVALIQRRQRQPGKINRIGLDIGRRKIHYAIPP